MLSRKCILLHGTSVYFCIFLHYEYAKSNLSRRRETLLFPLLPRALSLSRARALVRSVLLPIGFCVFSLSLSLSFFSSTSNNIIEKKGAQCHLVITFELFPGKHETRLSHLTISIWTYCFISLSSSHLTILQCIEIHVCLIFMFFHLTDIQS